MTGMDRWLDPRLQAVKVADVQRYLLARGWKLQPFPRPELLVFEGPKDDNGEPIVQILPSSEQLVDYRQRLTELITALAILEDRSAQEVLTDILPPPANGPTPRKVSRRPS